MTVAEVQVKWSVILIDRLSPDIFSTLEFKGHVLHRARAHFKVPGCSLVWNTLQTKKLPMFLSRLNEINGGWEKILPVSGSFWSNLKFFRMIDFTAWLWGWNVRVNGILLLVSLCDSVGKTKLSCYTSHRRSTTVSLETYPSSPVGVEILCNVTHSFAPKQIAWLLRPR